MGSASTKDRRGLSVRTLVISSLAALLAAVIVSLFWERGTLIATAVTPVIVALVGEGLSRPAERIEQAATSAVTKPPPGDVLHGQEEAIEGSTDEPVRGPRSGEEPAEGSEGIEKAASGRDPRNRRIAIAVGTGILAFAIAAVVITGTDLVTGGSLGTGGRTTLFGGNGKSTDQGDKTPQSDRPSGSTDEPGGAGQPDAAGEDQPATPGDGQPETAPLPEAPPEESAPEEPGEEPPGDASSAPPRSGAETTP